jgi:hypothetical protein
LTPNFGDPVLNLCLADCPINYFGDAINNRTCVKVCPDTYYGDISLAKPGKGGKCVYPCNSGWWGDDATRLCTNLSSGCTNGTYADQTGWCVTPLDCYDDTYANNYTNTC